MATFIALINALPQLLKLLNAIMTIYNNRVQQGIGRNEAMKEAIELSQKDIDAATEERAKAKAQHQANPTSDDAFNNEFRRD
jgi:hypothetical protein